jgi:hypothetical protein
MGARKGGERSSPFWLLRLLKLQQELTNNNGKGGRAIVRSYNLKEKKKKQGEEEGRKEKRKRRKRRRRRRGRGRKREEGKKNN